MALSKVQKSALFVGLSVCMVLVGLRHFHVTKTHDRSRRQLLVERADKPKFTFDDIYNTKFSYKAVSPRWVSGTEYIEMDDDDNIVLKNVADDSQTILMNGNFYTSNSASAYKVSADQKYIALRTNYKKGWRHSYNATYLIYDVDAGSIDTDLTTPDDTQYFTWAPVGNALAYVNGFDIYYKATVNATVVRVTSDGRANYIYNGIPDWVYEEEMISSNNVIYFSPDGKYLAYAKFDDTDCKRINYERYDESPDKYPISIVVSYPKAGTTQPTNQVLVFNTESEETKEIEAPSELTSDDYLFNRLIWANPTRAAVTWSNRIQTKGVMRFCDISETNFELTYVDSDNFMHESTTGWLYQRRPYWIPVFGATSDDFYTVRPNDNWQHLYHVNLAGETSLTEGDFTVTSESASYPSVEIYDNATGHIYFSATKTSPQHRHLFRPKSGDKENPECITCKYAEDYPGRCDYITSSFSTDGSYVIIRCAGDGPPLYIQAKIDHTATSEDAVLTEEVILQNNTDLITAVEETDMSEKEYGKFTSGGNEFTYQIWFPPNMDKSGATKYPLLIDVYAGPGYQRVYASWSRGWSSRFLPSSLDIVVASVDGRGSNYYGEDFMHSVYKKLGQLEPIDQLEFAKHMSSMDYIDSDRIAVWGWSYGGYATSHILGNDADNTIKCGLAVAPLADWMFYDTIYSERYMSLPTAEDNMDGYEKASVLPLTKNFRQSSYFLTHGTADDNVHFQNAARIEHELVENDIDFNDFYYADQAHSINEGNARKHVYKVLTRQICQCFGLAVPDGVWT